MGRVYAVASGKGGVGKTATVANLGAALAGGGYDVVVVDTDLGMGNLGSALGVDPQEAGAHPDAAGASHPAGATIHDVLAGTASTADAVYEGADGVAVVPGSADLDAFGRADPAGLRAVVGALDDYDYVLLDTSAGLSNDSVIPLGVADEVLLVATPDRHALVDTEKTREVAGRLDSPVAGLVLTRVEGDVDAPLLDVVETEVRGRIPEDPEMRAAISAGEPAVVRTPRSPAALAYRRLAADLFDAELAPEDVDPAPAGDEGPPETSGGVETTETEVEASEVETTETEVEASEVETTETAESEVEPGGAEGEPETEPTEPPIIQDAEGGDHIELAGDADAVDEPSADEPADVAAGHETSDERTAADDGESGASRDEEAEEERGGFLKWLLG
jgi:septum site-determining protein MinD